MKYDVLRLHRFLNKEKYSVPILCAFYSNSSKEETNKLLYFIFNSTQSNGLLKAK